MLSSRILSYVTFAYGISFILFIAYYLIRKKKVNHGADAVVLVTFVLHGAAIVLRWVESYRLGWGHIPLTNFYESLIFFSFALTFIYLLFRYTIRYDFLGAVMMPFSLLTLAYASFSPDIDRAIRPLIPALQSNWLTIHVITCFLAYAAFTLSFACALLYFWPRRRAPQIIPTKDVLDELVYRGVLVGMPLLTMGIITGSAWAHYAWGAYWSWDPKETWSLITWIIYALFLHARLIRGWRENRTSLLSIIGFLAMLFTFLGVNFILSGLHAYM
jgi:cytochrome c-type biogenesis protein CcsB